MLLDSREPNTRNTHLKLRRAWGRGRRQRCPASRRHRRERSGDGSSGSSSSSCSSERGAARAGGARHGLLHPLGSSAPCYSAVVAAAAAAALYTPSVVSPFRKLVSTAETRVGSRQTAARSRTLRRSAAGTSAATPRRQAVGIPLVPKEEEPPLKRVEKRGLLSCSGGHVLSCAEPAC